MKWRLTIELVPKTSWFSNVRSEVSEDDWGVLRRRCYREADYKCEICGGKGDSHPVECHEVWSYDDTSHIQKLVRLIALCPRCHETKHIGLAGIKGREDVAIEHLAKVNNVSLNVARKCVEMAFETWQERSEFQWTLDLSYLDDLGISYKKR